MSEFVRVIFRARMRGPAKSAICCVRSPHNMTNHNRQIGPNLGVSPSFGGDYANNLDMVKISRFSGVFGHAFAINRPAVLSCDNTDMDFPVWDIPDFDFPEWEVPDWGVPDSEFPDWDFPEWEVPDLNEKWGPLPADDWGPLPNEDWGPLPTDDWGPLDGSTRNQVNPRHLKHFRPFLP